MSRAALDAPRARPLLPPGTERESRLGERPTARHDRARTLLARPLVACAVLLAAYASLSMLVEPGGFVAADTGGKVATLHVMATAAR